MLSVVLAAALGAAPLQPIDPTPARTANAEACRTAGVTSTATPPARPGARRLGDLPPALLMRTVLRRIGGCSVVEVARDDPRYEPQSSGGRRWVKEPAGDARFDRANPARFRNGFGQPTPATPTR